MIKHSLKLGVMLGCLSVSLLVVGCRHRVRQVDVATLEPRVMLLTEAHDPAKVRSAIISALQSRKWVTERETGNDIDARLSHRGELVRLSIRYEAAKVTFVPVEVEGRGFQRWEANLEASIREALATPAAVLTPVTPSQAPAAATPPPTLVVFETKQKQENVKSALQRALVQHNWVIEQEIEGGHLIARLNHRKGLVRIKIGFDVSQAIISYVSSQELDIDSAGRSADYEKWMRNLVDSIRNNTMR